MSRDLSNSESTHLASDRRPRSKRHGTREKVWETMYKCTNKHLDRSTSPASRIYIHSRTQTLTHAVTMVFPAILPKVDESIDKVILSALARIGPLLVNTSTVRSIASKLEHAEEVEWFVECETEEQAQNALDHGASKVLLDQKADGSIGEGYKKDTVLRLSSSDVDAGSIKGYAGVVLGKGVDASRIKDIRKSLTVPGLIFTEDTSYDSSSDVVSILSAASLTLDSIASSFISGLVTDRPDGFYPTIVSSPSSSPSPLALGLVYSSQESIKESITTGRGVYQSRRHGLWRKGETSGSTQRVVRIRRDCDKDALLFEVEQTGTGFCHLETEGCFSYSSQQQQEKKGLAALESTLQSRLADAPEGSYTARLFNDPKLLRQKIMEEAEELTEAETREHVAFEMADLMYFAMARCVKAGVSLADVERNLDEKANKGKKGIRRQGDAKKKWVDYTDKKDGQQQQQVVLGEQTVKKIKPSAEVPAQEAVKSESKPEAPVPKAFPTAPTDASNSSEMIRMRTSDLGQVTPTERAALLQRPVMDSSAMIERVKPIVSKVREGGDEALKSLTKQFDKSDLESNVLLPPFYPPPSGKELSSEIIHAIEQAYSNVKAFHLGQAEKEPLVVETMPGVVCTRFARPIDRVGIYVPGGTAILPSTALMLGVPAQVAGCTTIVLATPPRPDGSISPEVLYVAKLVGVDVILKAGGAQAVAAMAYGTETCPKVDKIFGPGNQWVTAAKMLVQNDTQALVGIDMPAGPSEVMVSHKSLQQSRTSRTRAEMFSSYISPGHCRQDCQPGLCRVRSSLPGRTRYRLSGCPGRHRPRPGTARRDRARGRSSSQRAASCGHHQAGHQKESDRQGQRY